MGGLSLPHLIVLAMVLGVFVYPASRILKRAGFSGWLALLSIIPFINIIGLWWFAFAAWPNARDNVDTFK